MEKKKKFKLFDFNRDGKGVDKEEVQGPPNLKNFFKLYGRKFTRLLSVNLYILLMFIPPVIMFYLFFTGEPLSREAVFAYIKEYYSEAEAASLI